MNDLFEYIIAAKNNKPVDFSWVVPVFFVLFYVIAGIARARQKPEEPEQEDQPPTEEELKASERWRQKALRERLTHEAEQKRHAIHLSEEDQDFDRKMPQKGRQIAPQRKKVLREMMEEVYRQATGMPLRQVTKEPRKVARHQPLLEAHPQKPLPAKKPATPGKPQKEDPPEPAGKFARIERMSELQRAIVYSEIIGRPVAFRPDTTLPGLS